MDASLKRIFKAAGSGWVVCAMLAMTFVTPVWADVAYRWIDEEGESFYSPVPPTDPDQPYVMLRDGVVVERFAGLERPEKPESEFDAQRQAEEAQRKADALLMVQFRTLADIDAAMENELDNLRYDFNLLDGTWESLRKSLFEQIGIAADRQRAGLNVAQHELEQIQAIRQRMSANRTARNGLTVREQSIREEYAAKKQRFQVLVARQAGP